MRLKGWVFALLAVVSTATAASVAAPEAPPAPAARFGDEIAVSLVTVPVRVVDGAGSPILGLMPGDFRVRVGRREVAVAAVDWVSSAHGEVDRGVGAAGAATSVGGPEAATATSSTTATSATTATATTSATTSAKGGEDTGRLVVILVQADNNAPSRVRGHLRTLPFTRELVESLGPEDRVAVVSFDSHLKLWQDFTGDRRSLQETIYQAIHFGGRAPRLADLVMAPAGEPSLGRHFDDDEARQAASPERALAVVAKALAAIPGEKALVFLAWGLGTFSSQGTQMTPAFAPAVRALAAARTSVFVLDVTEADGHDLEAGLRGIADATGGTYDKTFLFPALAVRQLAQTLAGYYVLTLDTAALPGQGGDVAVELRSRRGTVLLRPRTLPPA